MVPNERLRGSERPHEGGVRGSLRAVYLQRDVLKRLSAQMVAPIAPEQLLSHVVDNHVTPQRLFAALEDNKEPAAVLKRYLLQGGDANERNADGQTLWEVILDNLQPDCLRVLGDNVGATRMSNWRNAVRLTPLMVLARESLPSAKEGDTDLLMAAYLLDELKVDQRLVSGKRHGRKTAYGMAKNLWMKRMIAKAGQRNCRRR